jgi:hypothetical protein
VTWISAPLPNTAWTLLPDMTSSPRLAKCAKRNRGSTGCASGGGRSLVITALIIAGIVATVAYWLNTSGYESTDDAFIDARTVSISAQVGAAIVDVPVTDNQLVEAGAVLAKALSQLICLMSILSSG